MTELVQSVSEVLSWAEQDGVDLSLLRENLKFTPTERLQRHEMALELAIALREAGRKRRNAKRESSNYSTQ